MFEILKLAYRGYLLYFTLTHNPEINVEVLTGSVKIRRDQKK